MEKKKRPLSSGKKLIILLIVLALVVGAVYLGYYLMRYTFYDEYRQFISHISAPEDAGELELGKEKLEGYKGYKLALESEHLKLYLNESTSDVAILDKRTGAVTFAVPPDAEDDPIANGTNKKYLQSHVIVNYFNAARTEGTYDSFSMAVDRDQVTYSAIDGGIRVTYLMGDFSKSMGVVPQYLSEEKFAEIQAQLPEEEAKAFGRYYSTNSDVGGMRQLLKTARNNRSVQQKLQTMLDTVGFTEEDFTEQMALAGSNVKVPISFTVALDYILGPDYMEVSVPVDLIDEGGGASIFRIQLLRNFAAAGAEAQGYIVVPNGDGSIIRFNNGKTGAALYSQHIYGIDPLAADYTVLEQANPASMALFGMVKEDATILATIEDGAALASVTAGVAGRINNYNYCYTSFLIRGSETLEMFGTTGNEATLPIVEPTPYDTGIRVRYSFLDKDHTGYSGIANYYRDRLIGEGVLTPGTGDEQLKFYYDVIAGVEMTEFFLGKQYMGLTPMTTFDQAGQMSDILLQKGISNQVMNIQGWFNGGYYHDAASRILPTWKLGGKSGLEDLNATLAANGGTLYADVIFQKVPFRSKWFNYQAESSKYYGSGYVVSFGQVNPANLRQTSSLGYSETMYDLISPKFLVRYVEKFSGKFQNYDVAGISLRDLGSTLHSDKKRTNIINRDQALDVVLGSFGMLEATGKNLMVKSSNDYAWAYADDILSLPLSDNEYVLVDENIPLYQMIVHGSIDYCGGIYNLTDAGNDREKVLTMIEYGAAPHFLFTWENTTEMKYSGLNGNYATTFANWVDKAAEVYAEVSSALSGVTGDTIVSHEILENGLRKVTYSDGSVIYVNYTGTQLTDGGITVPAMGWALG